jgi:hypothetical protein
MQLRAAQPSSAAPVRVVRPWFLPASRAAARPGQLPELRALPEVRAWPELQDLSEARALLELQASRAARALLELRALPELQTSRELQAGTVRVSRVQAVRSRRMWCQVARPVPLVAAKDAGVVGVSKLSPTSLMVHEDEASLETSV